MKQPDDIFIHNVFIRANIRLVTSPCLLNDFSFFRDRDLDNTIGRLHTTVTFSRRIFGRDETITAVSMSDYHDTQFPDCPLANVTDVRGLRWKAMQCTLTYRKVA